jgi:hypothetical protein
MSDRIRTPATGYAIATADRSLTESRSPGLLRRREQPSWLRLATEKLKSAATLQDNWDSYGGLRTNSLSLHHANLFLDCICKTVGITEPLIAVNAHGNVCFEWDLDGSSMELEVLPSGKVSYYFVDAEGDEVEAEDQSDFMDVRDRLTRL